MLTIQQVVGYGTAEWNTENKINDFPEYVKLISVRL